MDLDLRVPIGFFFVLVGLIMGIFGLTSDPAIYQKSFGINVNLDWGIVELIFGSLMLVFGRRHPKNAEPIAATAAASLVSRAELPPEPKMEPPLTHR